MVGSAPPLMGLPTFVSLEPFVPGQTVTLGEDDAHHMKVRRLELGSRVALVDGAGTRGEGTLVRLAKRHAAVLVAGTSTEAPPPAVHLVLPIADRDRMLWLAEKTAEIGVSSWRPVSFRRSKSVSPRGEGTVFTQKVAARMASALEQSGGSWLPTIYPASKLDRAIAASPTGVRLVLEQGGAPIERALDEAFRAIAAKHGVAETLAPVTLVVGPEGGLEPDELKDLEAGGFAAAALGRTVLRFETAAIAALAVVRAAIDSRMAGAPARKTMGDDDDG